MCKSEQLKYFPLLQTNYFNRLQWKFQGRTVEMQSFRWLYDKEHEEKAKRWECEGKVIKGKQMIHLLKDWLNLKACYTSYFSLTNISI